MRTYRDYNDHYGSLICELDSFDVDKAEKEFALYMRKEGEIYNLDWYKEPRPSMFFKIYFGEEDGEGGYFEPDMYVLPDWKTATRFFKFAKCREFHDRFNQRGIDVKQDKNIVYVTYFDY